MQSTKSMSNLTFYGTYYFTKYYFTKFTITVLGNSSGIK